MTLEKAIEILTTELKTAEHQTDPDFYNALELGIEALKRLMRGRERIELVTSGLLPGETTD